MSFHLWCSCDSSRTRGQARNFERGGRRGIPGIVPCKPIIFGKWGFENTRQLDLFQSYAESAVTNIELIQDPSRPVHCVDGGGSGGALRTPAVGPRRRGRRGVVRA